MNYIRYTIIAGTLHNIAEFFYALALKVEGDDCDGDLRAPHEVEVWANSRHC